MTETPTTAHDRLRAERVERCAADLVSGTAFAVAANAHRANSYMGHYQPPIRHDQYGQAVEALGRFARQGDRYAAAAHTVLRRLPLYGNANQVLAKVAEALHEIASTEYRDVIGESGPEASRPSAHRHATTLRWALLLDLLSTEIGVIFDAGERIGWTTQALMDREGMDLPAHLFPNIIAEQKRSAEIAARYRNPRS